MTLTELSYYSRKIIPVIFIGFIFFIIFFFAIKALFTGAPIPQPNQPATPTAMANNPCFGKIKKITFSHTIDYPSEIQFTLDTIEGIPVSPASSQSVYYLPKKRTRFGYMQAIYLMAKSLGFDTEVVKHIAKDTVAIFEDETKRFDVDIATYNFSFNYKYEQSPELFMSPDIPEENRIKEDAKQFLRLMGVYSPELAKGKENLIYLNYNDQTKEFLPVLEKSQANAVEIDFFRPDIDTFPMVSPKYFNAHNYVVLTYKDNVDKVIRSQVNFFPMEESDSCVYPLKTGNEAWQELIKKKGFIVSGGENNPNIKIKKMFLGYYDPDVYQEYLQPVYVFLGENGFAAYVPALKNN